jgi:hypothetical protein
MFSSTQAVAQYVIAGNPQVSSQLLESFSRSPEPRVRARVAENAATPVHVLTRLLQDNNTDVRLSLSNNQKLPKIFMAQLARDESPDVRLGLAENPLVPKSILQVLTSDDNPYVSSRARRTLDRLIA